MRILNNFTQLIPTVRDQVSWGTEMICITLTTKPALPFLYPNYHHAQEQRHFPRLRFCTMPDMKVSNTVPGNAFGP